MEQSFSISGGQSTRLLYFRVPDQKYYSPVTLHGKRDEIGIGPHFGRGGSRTRTPPELRFKSLWFRHEHNPVILK